MSKVFHIAVDGPVSAGKGTVCRLVADKLGILYVDTGATYRVTALLGIRHEVELTEEAKLVAILKKTKIEMRLPTEDERDGRLLTVIMNDEDVSWKIRTEEVSKGSSAVAALPEVRKVLVEIQQKIASHQDVVMEGRDITYRVLPQADLKIFLTASDLVRAKRRHLQLQTRGEDVTFEEVYRDLLTRDKNDSERAVDPLQIVDDAWVIDTSDLSISQVVEAIVQRATILREQSSHA